MTYLAQRSHECAAQRIGPCERHAHRACTVSGLHPIVQSATDLDTAADNRSIANPIRPVCATVRHTCCEPCIGVLFAFACGRCSFVRYGCGRGRAECILRFSSASTGRSGTVEAADSVRASTRTRHRRRGRDRQDDIEEHRRAVCERLVPEPSQATVGIPHSGRSEHTIGSSWEKRSSRLRYEMLLRFTEARGAAAV